MSTAGENEPTGFQPDLARLLLFEETISGLLDIVVNLSVSAVPGVQGASISLVLSEGDQLQTSHASSQVIREVDEGQYQDDNGPCVSAIRTGREVTVTVPAEEWPTFNERAVEANVTSVLSLPLRVHDRTTGALNLYSIGGSSPSEAATAVARDLAAQAAVVLANATALASAELIRQHLEEALKSRDIIGQAKGILMAREGISADEAFDTLRRASQRTNRKLRDIAAEVATHQPGENTDQR
jgi:GAF domain-containing protein